MHWQKQRNILAFPYAWQRPAKTEEWAYYRCLSDLPENRYIQVVCFPWATLIDLLRSTNKAKAKFLIEALYSAPPRTTLARITICQHIYLKEILPFFKQLKITDIFWSHAVVGEKEIDGIQIHAFPLYPVRCADFIETNQHSIPLTKRKYLYSFIGTYEADLYLTQVRQWIFNLPQRIDAYIQRRNEWHYEKHVYREQVAGIDMKPKQLEQYRQFSQDYTKIMQDTIFCLCPSGSGPNSIRLWEALGFGCIPVILSDTLKLPGNAKLWQSGVITIPEEKKHIATLAETLEHLAIENYQTPIAHLWECYGLNNFIEDIKNLSIG